MKLSVSEKIVKIILRENIFLKCNLQFIQIFIFNDYTK